MLCPGLARWSLIWCICKGSPCLALRRSPWQGERRASSREPSRHGLSKPSPALRRFPWPGKRRASSGAIPLTSIPTELPQQRCLEEQVLLGHLFLPGPPLYIYIYMNMYPPTCFEVGANKVECLECLDTRHCISVLYSLRSLGSPRNQRERHNRPTNS